MNIAPAKNANAAPKTRRALLSHLWGLGLECNVFKEGPFYAVMAGGIISATHVRAIDDLSFNGWAARVNDTLSLAKH